MAFYSNEFYSDRYRQTIYSAEKILEIVKLNYPNINSAIDIGCGVGAFLSHLIKTGITDVIGIDGNWVNKEHLCIPKNLFIEQDLKEKIIVNRKFDLVICLEVAEHLPKNKAIEFIESLTGLSNLILFSAAIPGQGGLLHFNEQWPEYWINIFKSYNYECHDIVRNSIWEDSNIPFWYRQNTFIFCKDTEQQYNHTEKVKQRNPLTIIHPELYNRYRNVGIKKAIKNLLFTIKDKIIGTKYT